jgi:hypothetical protein
MPISLPQSLDDLCLLLRTHGVTHASVDGITLTFGPAPKGSSTPEEQEPAEDEPDTCRCGHPYHLHSSDAGCFEGCPIALCVPADKDI